MNNGGAPPSSSAIHTSSFILHTFPPMPFDPTLPQPNTLVDADVMRQQLNALHDENTALEARVAALEALVLTLATQTQLNDAIATRAPKPTGISPLPYGASDPPTQAEVQGGFDLLANLIGALKA
jgi:hypothetical protein